MQARALAGVVAIVFGLAGCSRAGFVDGLDIREEAPAHVVPAPLVSLTTPSPTASREVGLAVECAAEHVAIVVSDGGGGPPPPSAPGWRACEAAIIHVLSGADGDHVLEVWARDALGVSSSEPARLTVTLDTTGPELSWITEPAAVVAGGEGVALAWSATEPHAEGGAFVVEISTDGGDGWTVLEERPVTSPLAATIEPFFWIAPEVETSAALLRVSLTDALGNAGVPASTRAFAVDALPPVVDAFTLADGAASTASTQIAVAVTATDLSAVEGRLSQSPVFVESGWRPLAELTSFTLSGAEGGKTLYLWVRDAVGHQAPPVSRGITLTTLEAWTNVTFVEGDRVVPSGSGAQQLTLRLGAPRARDARFLLEVLGDALYGVDHDLEDGREVVVPAGQVLAPVTFDLLDPPRPPGYARLEVRVLATDSPRVQIDDGAVTRLAIRSPGSLPHVVRHALNFEATNGCAILSDGALLCWGINDTGQVGDGTTVDRPRPVVVDRGLSYLDVGVGETFACGVTASNQLKCWGSNTGGQLGDGSGMRRLTPVAIDQGVSYQRVAIGRYHGCGLTVGGEVRCWGSDTFAQLGNTASASSPIPIAIADTSVYTELRTFMHTTCGLTDGDALKCWGWNNNGQVGDNSTTNRETPAVIDPGVSYKAVSPGTNRTCAITATGAAKCWGSNQSGQLGDGTNLPRLQPVNADEGVAYIDIEAGLLFATCGITTAGELRCFSSEPLPQQSGPSWSELSGSERAACAIDGAGDVSCFLAGYGPASLGDGVLTYRRAPFVVDDRRAYEVLTLGAFRASGCALAGGVPHCWGGWPAGQASWGVGYTDFAMGVEAACGLAEGVLTCAGYGAFGPLDPHVVPTSSRYVALSVGGQHLCAITDTGALECMDAARPTPATVDPGVTYAQVSAACTHTCAVSTSGVLKCWGDNAYGQLGLGAPSASPTLTPTVVDAGTEYAFVATGCDAWSAHTCGVVVGGQLKCWGSNGVGQLGDGTTTPRASPSPIDTGVSYSAAALTRFNNGGIASVGSCALTVNGEVRCWGGGGEGQVGDGTFSQARTPQPVDPGVPYRQIARGKRSACGLTSAGALKCWGDDTAGDLGDAATHVQGVLLNLAPWLVP